jgi:hypothetical protein
MATPDFTKELEEIAKRYDYKDLENDGFYGVPFNPLRYSQVKLLIEKYGFSIGDAIVEIDNFFKSNFAQSTNQQP